jgi:hypothetical protein
MGEAGRSMALVAIQAGSLNRKRSRGAKLRDPRQGSAHANTLSIAPRAGGLHGAVVFELRGAKACAGAQ